MTAFHPTSDIKHRVSRITKQPHIATHLIIHGRVQGVLFREWTVETAASLRVFGWIRNMPDGTVEAHLEGEPRNVDRMIAALHDGPSQARVERIEQREVVAEGASGFRRR
ncbi:acylphosphatase [Qipengyuania sp. CAU 1752]